MNKKLQSYVNSSSLFLLLLAFALPATAQAPITYQYVYDSAGRVTEAIDSSGNALVYVYDAAGNLTAIQHLTGVQIAITGASTETGVAGEQVTFTGPNVGDCTPTVMFNGVSATVVATTTNSVTVIIPAGATSGPVTITNCHGTATSTFTFTIGEVIVMPPLAIVEPGISVQFSASVLPSTSSQAVIWSVDGIQGGNSAVGTITVNGLYSVSTAAAGVISIEATSVANPLLTGTATVRIVNTVNFDEAFSPGLSVLPSSANISSSTVPVYVVSPGVSVLVSPANLGAAIPVYIASPGVSVRLGLASGGGEKTAVYLVSPPVSVQLGAAGQVIPTFVFSPGVSVTNLIPSTGADQGIFVIVSPGVSVAPSAAGGSAFPPGLRPQPIPRSGPLIDRIQPAALHRGSESVTVSGSRLDTAKAVGFLDDAGHLDTNITVQAADVSPGGRALILHLSIGNKAAPGRRRLVFWSLPPKQGPNP